MRAIEARAEWIEENAGLVARTYGISRDDRDEFRQEAALKACQLWARFPRADEAYVFRAMHNAVLSLLRRRRTRRHLSVPAHDLVLDPSDSGSHASVSTTVPFGETLPDDAPSPLDAALGSDELRRALAVLASLPPEMRETFVAAATVGVAEHVRASGKPRRHVVRVLAAARRRVGEIVRASQAVAL